jgi:hypothetical protein
MNRGVFVCELVDRCLVEFGGQSFMRTMRTRDSKRPRYDKEKGDGPITLQPFDVDSMSLYLTLSTFISTSG